jgi:uncharacterized membrane protein YcaP (DUF421 family)
VEIPDFGSGIFDVVARTTIVYVVLLLLLRVGGKRKVGQLSIPDLVLVLLIANGVQNAMVGQNTSLVAGIVAAVTLVALDRVADILEARSDRARKVLEGEPRLLVHDGVILPRALKEEDVTEGDLLGAIRQHGLRGLEDVGLAVLETNGSISIIPRDPSIAPVDAAPPPATG